MTDYTALKAKYATISPAPSNGPSALAAINTINTVTVQIAAAPYEFQSVLSILQKSGSWARIVARSRQTPALPPATPTDAAILAAINATEMQPTETIDPADTVTMSALNAGISALEAIGDVTAADVTAVQALASVATPWWQASGLTSIVNIHDLIVAGLVTEANAKAWGIF